MMLKKLAGLGFLVLLLSFPLHADHKRSRHRGNGGAFIEIHVGTRHGHGSFVRDFRGDGHRYDDRRSRRDFKRFKKQQRRYFKQQQRFIKAQRRYFKKHRHYHYNGRCPY